MSCLNNNGSPWLLLDRAYDTLWRFEHGPHGENPRLTRLKIWEGENLLPPSAAIPWSSGTLLLATDVGLRAFDPATGKLVSLDLPSPSQPPHVLTRDGLGRLWLGCENGLWVIEPAAKTIQPFDRVPLIGRNKVHDLAPDPRHEDGVIVALGSRGIVFIRALRKP